MWYVQRKIQGRIYFLASGGLWVSDINYALPHGTKAGATENKNGRGYKRLATIIKKSLMNYKYIQAWCKLLGSHKYYIDKQVAKATEMNAPEEAIFLRDTGVWAVLVDMPDNVQRELRQIVTEIIVEKVK